MDPILIVDDEKDNLWALERLLRSEFQVDTSDSPIDALQKVQTKKYHVIVSDQRMPEMTGVELLEKIKRLTPNTSRVLLTGYTDIDSVIDSINRGNIYRYIAKPWEPAELKITLRQANEAFLLKAELEDKNLRLANALQELQALDKAKSRFLSLVSHELNTPITVLQSFFHLFQEENSSSKEKPVVSSDGKTNLLEPMSRALNRLSEIVREVINYTKLETDTSVRLTRENCLDVLMLSETEIRKSLLKSVVIKKDCDASLTLLCDKPKIIEIIKRLCLELAAFSADEISLRAFLSNLQGTPSEQDQGWITIHISHKGSFLSNDCFEPFVAGEELLNHQKNLGLSLPVCKLLVESQGGKISMEKTATEENIIVQFHNVVY